MNHVFYFDEIPRIPIRTYITSGLGGVTTDSNPKFHVACFVSPLIN